MPIKMKPIREIPKEALQRQTRSSLCTDTIDAIKASPTQKAELTAETPARAGQVLQDAHPWRSRHKDQNVNFRKTREVLYVWIGDAKEDPEAKSSKPTGHQQALEANKLAHPVKRGRS